MNSIILRSFSIFLVCVFCFFFLSAATSSESEIATSSSNVLKKDNSIKKEKKQLLEIFYKKENLKSTKQKNRFQILKKIYKLRKAVKKSKKFKNKKGKSKSARFLAVLGMIFSGLGILTLASLTFVIAFRYISFLFLGIIFLFMVLLGQDVFGDLRSLTDVKPILQLILPIASTLGLVGLILSIIALRKLNRSPELVDKNGYEADEHEKKKHQDGTRLFAIAGIVLGIIALFSILVLFMI